MKPICATNCRCSSSTESQYLLKDQVTPTAINTHRAWQVTSRAGMQLSRRFLGLYSPCLANSVQQPALLVVIFWFALQCKRVQCKCAEELKNAHARSRVKGRPSQTLQYLTGQSGTRAHGSVLLLLQDRGTESSVSLCHG